jgi:hypothetical protein
MMMTVVVKRTVDQEPTHGRPVAVCVGYLHNFLSEDVFCRAFYVRTKLSREAV